MHIQRRIRRCMQKKRAPGKSLVDELVHLLNARKQRDQLKLCCVQTIEPICRCSTLFLMTQKA